MSGELGLYLHLPFCPGRCPYCDFYSQVYQPGQARELIAGLARHLELAAPLAGGRALSTVYFGGGTPSMLPVSAVASLLEAIDRAVGIEAGAEVSLEANPGTLSRAKLGALRAAGFNRLSIGAQSMDPAMLEALGRRHGADDTRRAFSQARSAGFENLSLDLIYGLPHQGPASAAADIEAALALSPDHLSLYELTLGPDTIFGRRYTSRRPPLPSEDAVLAMEDAAYARLDAAGLARYEVSNFSRGGMACRHNRSTWQGGDYLALGPGAHGHLSGRRWAFVADAAAYLERLAGGEEPVNFSEVVPAGMRALELFMLGLRTTEGVDLSAVEALLGCDPRVLYEEPLKHMVQRGWADLDDQRLIPTAEGLRMADSAAWLFAM